MNDHLVFVFVFSCFFFAFVVCSFCFLLFAIRVVVLSFVLFLQGISRSKVVFPLVSP